MGLMTTIRNDGADSFVRRPPSDMRFFLVHGNDEGLIHERAKSLVGAVLAGDLDPLRLTRMEGDALAREPGRLADEAYSVSMFGGHRALWIDAGSRDLASQLEPLFERPPQDCTLILEAGSLRKGAALRTMFEQSGASASIECYPDERRALMTVIDSEARDAGLQVTNEAREYLVTLLGSDRLTSRGEVSKLMMYARGSAKVEASDVEAIVADAAPSGLDALIDQSMLGNTAEVEKVAARYFSDGGDAGYLLMRLVSRVILLHHVRLEMEQGKSFDMALGQFVRLPPSGRVALAKQAERWTAEALSKRLPAIQAVVARARRQSGLAEVIATRALWALASGARAGRG